MTRLLSTHSWTAGLALLLVLLLVSTKLIQPDFGITGLESLARAALPFALATLGMAVVIIAGGIDLSIAAMMAMTKLPRRWFMTGISIVMHRSRESL